MLLDGYGIEGLVPMEIITKLLEERPQIIGVTLPGRQVGAPGMPGEKKGPLVIYAVMNREASPTIYAMEW